MIVAIVGGTVIALCAIAYVALELQMWHRAAIRRAYQAGQQRGTREATARYRAGIHTTRYQTRLVARENQRLQTELSTALFELSICKPPDPIVRYVAEVGRDQHRSVGLVELVGVFGDGTMSRVTSLVSVGFLDGDHGPSGLEFSVPVSRRGSGRIQHALPAPVALVDTVEHRHLEAV